MPLLSYESPCIGFCSTVYGDDVCRGCNRFFEEVVNWERLPPERRHAAIERIHAVLRRAVNEFVRIDDPRKLAERLRRHQVPLPEIDSPQAQVLALLYAGSHLMHDLSAYGLSATERALGLSPQDIKIAIVQRRVELAQPMYADWLEDFMERPCDED